MRRRLEFCVQNVLYLRETCAHRPTDHDHTALNYEHIYNVTRPSVTSDTLWRWWRFGVGGVDAHSLSNTWAARESQPARTLHSSRHPLNPVRL